MRKLIFCLCCLLWAIPACAGDLELDLECLQEAYPGFITGTETDDAGHVWFLTKNGGRLLYNDGKMKSHAELLENADIEDAMRQPYPLEPERPDFTPDEEPGRIRCYPLLKALYGADQRSVERGIVRTLFGGKIKVRLAAPAAEAFQRIDTAEAQARRSRTEQLFFAHLRLFLARHRQNEPPEPAQLRDCGGSQSRQGPVLAMEQTPPASVAEDLPLRHRLTL